METEVLTLDNSLTKQEELTNKDSSNEQLVKREPIKDSPFVVISIEDKKHFGVMGEYRVTEEMESKEKVEKELKKITWNRMIQVIMILDEIKSKDEDFNKNVKEELNQKNK